MSLVDRANRLVQIQGSPAEDHLLYRQIVVYGPHGTAHQGVNRIFAAVLDDGQLAFHKTFAGVEATAAYFYGHHDPNEIPIHECAAWRLAERIGQPFSGIVAPCVLRAHEGEAGSLVAQVPGLPDQTSVFQDAPDMSLAAGFFDSLIAQQDRHLLNYRWDAAAHKLGLFDHGYAFARPGQILNASVFVEWRHTVGAAALQPAELDALNDLLGSGDLHGLRSFLRNDEADALEHRASTMIGQNQILPLGQF